MIRPRRPGWWKPLWTSRPARRPRLGVEELDARQLPSVADPFGTALPLVLNAGPRVGAISPAPTTYEFTVTEPGRLVAEVAPTGGPTRLTLRATDGTVLMQSDGRSPIDPTDHIDLHLVAAAAGTTYYLDVQGLGGAAGTYAIRADFARATPPFQPLQASGLVWGHAADLNRDGVADLAVSDFDGRAVSVFLGLGDGTFAPAARYTVGAAANDVVAADVTGDGAPDLISANFDGSLSVLVGRGDGTFLPQTVVPLGVNPSAIATGDFDGDGRTDLAVADYGANRVEVLRGTGGGTFAAPVGYAVGSGPYELIAGDFSGDGRADLAVANYNDNTVSLLVGNPDGTFRPLAPVPVGGEPYGIAAGDFDGNGQLDLATANYSTNDVTVLLGAGGGAFRPAVALAAGAGAYGVAVGDFDGDGRPDLAASNFSDGTVSVFAGRGDGTFAAQAVFPVGPSPALLVAADFNRDGRADLAHGDYAGHVGVNLGRGDGTFQIAQTTGAGGGSYAPAAADFDRDGRPDVAVLNYNTSDVQLFLGRGDGTFRPGGRFTNGSDGIALAAGDLNRDGAPDLIVSNYSTASVSVLLGRGDGTFAAPAVYATGLIPYQAVVGDYNGDGTPDLAVPTAGSNAVSILLGRGDGAFAPALDVPVGDGPMALAAGDFDGDGRPDLVTANADSNDLSVLFGAGDGTFGAGARLPAGSRPVWVAVGDFDGDGRPDLATANSASPFVSVFLAGPGGSFRPRVDVATPFNPFRVRAADFDGDGALDLVAVGQSEDRLAVLFGRRDGTFRVGPAVVTGDTPWGVADADVNGDGAPDVVAVNVAAGDFTTFLNAGDGTFPRQLRTPVLDGPVASAQGDVNNDGFTDLVTADNAAGTVSVRLGQGDGTFRAAVTYLVGTAPTAVALADGNRDGRLDVIVTNSLDNTATVLLGIGDGTFRWAATLPVGTTPVGVVGGDLNTDGFADVVVASAGSGDITVLLGQRHAAPVASTYLVVGGVSAVAVADVNGDGIPDVVVANDGARGVTVLLGNGDGTLRATPGVFLGVVPVALTVADVTGDGRPDVVTANPGDRSVTVLSGNGDGTFGAAVRVAVGGAPTSVAAGDYDGDGWVDLVVADGNENVVHVLLGRGGGTFAAASPVAVGNSPATVVAADFNNDGRLDLGTTNALGAPLSVVLGLGTGAFTAPGAALPPVAAAPVVADLNHDGVPDVVSLRSDGAILFRAGRAGQAGFAAPVVVNPDPAWAARTIAAGTVQGVPLLYAANARSNADAIYAYLDGGFVRVYSSRLGSVVPSVALVADVSGDGRDDLVVGSAAAGKVYVTLQRPGDDLSDRPWDYELDVGVGFSGLTVADVTGDGRADIVFTEPLSGTVGVRANDPAAPFARQLRFRAGEGLVAVTVTGMTSLDTPVALAVGHFDADAIPDVAVLNRGSREVTVLRGAGSGGLFNPVPLASLRTGLDPVSILAVDFNRDGYTDLAVLNRGDADVSIFLSDGRGGFVEKLGLGSDGRPARAAAGGDPTGMTAIDLNGDGFPGLRISSPTGDVLALLGNGDGTFRPYERLDPRVALAVSDQDGQAEFALASRTTDRVEIQTADSAPTFRQGRTDGVRDPNAVRFADLNRDGLADLVVSNGGGNAVVVYLGLGDHRFGPANRFFVGTNPGGITVADVNADGAPDLVIANAGSQDVSVLLGGGRGGDWTMTAGPRLRAGAGPTATVVLDVTGDGIADILVANGEADTVSLLPGVGGGFFDDRRPVVFHTGSRPTDLFVGEFDGTAGLDLVTVNAGAGDLTVFSGFGAPRAVAAAGLTSVRAVAGDFTGDGTLDLLVASADGRFSLIARDGTGLRMAMAFTSGLTAVSDMGLGSAPAGTVQVYVTLDGRDAAVLLTFVLSVAAPTPPEPVPVPFVDSGGSSDDGTVFVSVTTGGGAVDPAPGGASAPDRFLVTEFSTPVGAPLELLATLVLGAGADLAGVARTLEEGVATAGLVWCTAETGEWEDGGDETDEGDAAAVGRNGLITGATEAPLREYLRREGETEAAPLDVTFPSPFDLFDGSGRPPAPDHMQAADAPVPPDQLSATEVGPATGPAEPVAEPADGWWNRFSLRAAAVYALAVLAVLGWPVAPTQPGLTRRAARTSEGGSDRGRS
ncbi:VCBS repeat-containing protein [bacterium]|nr:VCBS repeat-containing protein [bacterium]